jgi:hypothetical protein
MDACWLHKPGEHGYLPMVGTPSLVPSGGQTAFVPAQLRSGVALYQPPHFVSSGLLHAPYELSIAGGRINRRHVEGRWVRCCPSANDISSAWRCFAGLNSGMADWHLCGERFH